jgi:hypothetical protein
MNDIELQLKDYLNKNPEIIKKSLDENYLHYDFIKVNNVEIENDGFMLYCQLTENVGNSITFLPIPEKFLRKMKLNKIKSYLCKKN